MRNVQCLALKRRHATQNYQVNLINTKCFIGVKKKKILFAINYYSLFWKIKQQRSGKKVFEHQENKFFFSSISQFKIDFGNKAKK